MKFVDAIGTELLEEDEVIVPYGNTLAMGKVAKLISGLGLGPQAQPVAIIAAMINPVVTPQGQVLNTIAVKSIKGEPAATVIP